MRSVSISNLLRSAHRRLIVPAGLAAVVGLATLTPAFQTPTAHVAAADREITPGKRKDQVVDVYERVKAGVVNIHSERTVNAPADDPFARQPVQPQRVNGMGTGIVLDPRGYILTNFHVVDDVHSLRIRLHDGTGHTARILALDKEADLALIKIDPSRPLPVIPFGTSSDLMVGESVIAIGNAYGYEHSITDGRVSYKGRDVTLNKEMGYKGLIQVSAPINPGNSGGPLLNIMGEIVGVNVAIRAGAQNIGFALPADFVIGRAADLIGKRRGGLRHGLVVRDTVSRVTVESPTQRSLVVESVEPGSPAALAGVKIGDVIEQVDDIAVLTSIDMERGFIDKAIGAKIPIKVKRDKESVALDLSFQAGAVKPVAATAADLAWKKLGVKLQPVAADAVAKANPQLHGGLLVTDVAVGSIAAASGIQKGDILVGLHTWETLNLDNVTFVLNHKDFATFQPLKFYLSREGKLRDGWITSVQ
ncbi:MAG: trypsin-like peptidase domain-containing protein [Planctomycetes bacterium]|nr:trypsin-like peptidase domain-containing protein [Planctomycetota bacterium]